MTDFSKEWSTYRESAMRSAVRAAGDTTNKTRAHISRHMIESSRVAFYAGAAIALTYLSECAAEDVSEEEGVKMVEGFKQELATWLIEHAHHKASDPEYLAY